MRSFIFLRYLFTLFYLAFLVPFRYEWHFDGISLFSVTRYSLDEIIHKIKISGGIAILKYQIKYLLPVYIIHI